MNQISKSLVLIAVIVVSLFGMTFAANAQDEVFCPALGGELQVAVGELHPTESLATQGYTCVLNADGTTSFQRIAPPVVGFFNIAESVTRLSVTYDGTTTQVPVSMVIFQFPIQGTVVGNVVEFKYNEETYSVPLVELEMVEEVAESAATALSLNSSDITIDTEVGVNGDGICSNVQTTFDEQFDNLGNQLNQPRRIDLSFQENQKWHLDYYQSPGKEAMSIYGFGGEKRVVLLGYGSIWVFELGQDCANYDLEADVRNYRTLRGTNQPNSFVLLNSGVGIHVTSLIEDGQPVINLFNRNSLAPFTVLEVGNDPVELGTFAQTTSVVQPQASVNATCVITSTSGFNIRSGMSLSSQASPQSANTLLTATALSTPDSDGFRWWSVSGGFVRTDAVQVVGNCALLSTSSGPAVSPVVRPAVTGGGSCAPAVEQVVADGRTVTGPVNIQAWESPINGNVVIPEGISVTGFKGAVWGYSSQSCAEADLKNSGKSYTVYSQ